MNPSSNIDPELQSLEARLADMAPRLPRDEQKQLLYECAFAAGRKQGAAALWKWRASAGSLAVVLLVAAAINIFAAGNDDRVGPSVATSPSQVAPAPRANGAFSSSAISPPSPVRSVRLDAWQKAPPLSRDSLDESLASWNGVDPHSRSLAVGALTRAALAP